MPAMELSGWASLPPDVLILVLKYCLTAVPYRGVVDATSGRAYGPILYYNPNDLSWSAAECDEDDRVRKAALEDGQAAALENIEGWQRGYKRGKEILYAHQRAFADVKPARLIPNTPERWVWGMDPESEDEDEDGEENSGAPAGSSSADSELVTFCFPARGILVRFCSKLDQNSSFV